jgi:septum formation inhibitor MinC
MAGLYNQFHSLPLLWTEIMKNQQTALIHIIPPSIAGDLPNIGSYSDLSKELKNRTALLIRLEEKIMDMDLETQSVGELKNVEDEISKRAKESLALCNALNQNVWAGIGISEQQHEEAGKKAHELMKEFKSLKNEVSAERRQKQTARQANLTEINAAMVIAPFATSGFLNLFFPKTPALSKGGAIVVFATEVVYVLYKRNPDQWKKASKEITTKGLVVLTDTGPQKIKQFFSAFAGLMKQRGKKTFAQAVKRVKKLINKNHKDNTPR